MLKKKFAPSIYEMTDVARSIALNYFRTNVAIADKADKTLVTIADYEIENCLRDHIRRAFPSHGIICEEFGQKNPEAEFVWIIDPIDGTKSFDDRHVPPRRQRG